MIFHFLTKTASGLAPGMRGPGPAKPVSPNGVKPLILGLPQAQNGAQAEEDAATQQEALAQQQESQQKGLEAQAQTQQAQMEAQQARNEAALAKQQLALAKEQQRAATSASSGGGAVNSSLLRASIKRMTGKANSLVTAAIGGPTSLLKAADARQPIKQVEPYNAHGEFAADAKRHGVNADGKSEWTFRDFTTGAKEMARNPDMQELPKMQQPWQPMRKDYRAGSLGSAVAPAVNAYADSYRHVLNNLPVMGQNALGAVSLPAQALGRTWDIGRDWFNEIKREGWNARPQDSPHPHEAADLAKRSVWPAVTSMGMLSPTGFATTAGLLSADDMSQQHSGKPLTQMISDKVAEYWHRLTGGQGQQEAPAQPAAPEATPDSSVMEWLVNLLMQMGQGKAQSPRQPLPSEVGAAGHVVRNPYALF